jgi:hypothetical protein
MAKQSASVKRRGRSDWSGRGKSGVAGNGGKSGGDKSGARSRNGNGDRTRRSPNRTPRLFPEVAWLYWLVPRRRKRLFKTKIAIVAVIALLVGRIAWVHFEQSLVVSDLQARGYMPDPSYDVRYSRRWIHKTDARKPAVTFFRYPRPAASPFERVSARLMNAYLSRPKSLAGRALLYSRTVFLAATAPFLRPIDSRTGFDPYSPADEEKAKEDLIRRLTKDSESQRPRKAGK